MGWVGTDCVGVWLAQYFVLLSHCCPLYGHTVLCTCDQTIRPFYKSSIVHRTLRVFESHSPCYSSAAIRVQQRALCCVLRCYSHCDDSSRPYYGDSSKPLRSFGWLIPGDLKFYVGLSVCFGTCTSSNLQLFGTGQCVLPWGEGHQLQLWEHFGVWLKLVEQFLLC